jgi:hypothetical protein
MVVFTIIIRRKMIIKRKEEFRSLEPSPCSHLTLYGKIPSNKKLKVKNIKQCTMYNTINKFISVLNFFYIDAGIFFYSYLKENL